MGSSIFTCNAGNTEVDTVMISNIPYMLDIEIPNESGNIDVRNGLQLFTKAVNKVDEYAKLFSTQTEFSSNQPEKNPTNARILELYQKRRNGWKGGCDLVIYIKVHSRATAGEIKKSQLFKSMHTVGVGASKEVWHTQLFQKVG